MMTSRFETLPEPRGRWLARSLFTALLAVGAFALLSACASVPPPTETLSAARFALDKAERAGGDEHAPLDVHVARENLSQAEAALAREDNTQARRLAERALVNAQLAEAKAEAANAEAGSAELRKSIYLLQTEADRASRDR